MAELTSQSTSSLRDWCRARLAEKECTVFFDRQWAAFLFLSLPRIPPSSLSFRKGLLQDYHNFSAPAPSTSAPRLSPAAAVHRHTNWPWFSRLCFKCTLLCVLRGAAMSVHSFPTGSLGHYLNEVLPLEVGEHMLTVRYWFWGLFQVMISLSSTMKEKKNIAGELFFIVRLDDLQVNYTFSDNTVCFHKVHLRATLYK